ncbi:hypothetical protein C9374_008119 [Naegleria lovaniensis]|uniref:SF4 helicase domain-containing protein n=1 Tax=Naegleria lovaniensis TaxID=51637 RepID=A0AA88GJY6_NAELO|nr:uncharacterized protein C9374_008119 [Naegleria lovaniensis]KAG2378480.1 hypothetical protein C9374_008119 [Naegleria lovaniensis]
MKQHVFSRVISTPRLLKKYSSSPLVQNNPSSSNISITFKRGEYHQQLGIGGSFSILQSSLSKHQSSLLSNIDHHHTHQCFHHCCNHNLSQTRTKTIVKQPSPNNSKTSTNVSSSNQESSLSQNSSNNKASFNNIHEQPFSDEHGQVEEATLEEEMQEETEPSNYPNTDSDSFNTFVSNYYKINENDIQEFLTRKGLPFRTVMNEIVIKDCPFCHDTKGKITNLWKLYINRHTGAYFCHRCGSKGSWFDFKTSFHKDSIISTLHSESSTSRQNNNLKSSTANTSQTNSKRRDKPTRKEFEFFRNNFDGPDFPEAVQYLEKVRGIKREVAQLYGVGCGIFPFMKSVRKQSSNSNTEEDSMVEESLERVNELCFTFPMYRPSRSNETSSLSRHKFRSIQDKTCMRLDPPQTNHWGLFGWHLIEQQLQKEDKLLNKTLGRADTSKTLANDSRLGGRKDPKHEKRIIITEGEFDAMAVYQKTGIPAVSLPNGCRSLPIEVIQWLESFDKIYLWMDDDVPGQQGAEMFSKKLGVGRCYIVHSSYKEEEEDDINLMNEEQSDVTKNVEKKPKDANDALLAGLDFHRLLEEATPIPHERILSFDSFKQQVYREFFDKSEQVNGIQSHFFPTLNKILKGFRRGELTIVTGATGIGKTTVLSQLSLDYCKYGNVPTLWGSFEIRNHRLIKKMMCQLAGKDLSINHAFDKENRKQEKLQLQVLEQEMADQIEDEVSMFDNFDNSEDPMSLMSNSEEEPTAPVKKQKKKPKPPKLSFTPKQYSPEELKREFELISEQFSELPMYFLNFYGSTDIDELLDAMDYAVYVYDVGHIVIDNLQFMMSTTDSSTFNNRFEMQDRAIEKLRKFATTKSVHVTLVVHPKKIDEKEQLQISSVFGTAKATQEADNIIMIQRNKHYKYLQVKKNRFDGTLGIIPYKFERHRGERITELSEKEIEMVENGQLEIDYE